MRRGLLLFVLPLAFFTRCSGPSDPEGVMAGRPTSFPDGWHRLDSTVAAAVEEQRIPGAVLLITRDGEVALRKAYGQSDPMQAIPMREDDLFRICSQSKAITATAAMILWERGLLDLDAPVARYLPSFTDIAVLDSLLPDSTFTTRPAASPPTIRQLMAHTVGIPYGEIGDDRFERIYAKRGITDLFPRDGRSTRDNVDRIGATCLLHDPGTQWTYGLGLDILVAVIEAVTEEPYAAFLHREILAPLGMVDTHFVVPGDKADRLVAVAQPSPIDGVWRYHTHRDYSTDYPLHAEWPLCGGGAGLTSTADDYARFLQLFLDRGDSPGGRLLQEATVDTIMADHAPVHRGDWHQGLAFGVADRNGSPGPFFWSGYFNTTGIADPATGTIVVLLKQTYGVTNDPTGDAVYALIQP